MVKKLLSILLLLAIPVIFGNGKQQPTPANTAIIQTYHDPLECYRMAKRKSDRETSLKRRQWVESFYAVSE